MVGETDLALTCWHPFPRWLIQKCTSTNEIPFSTFSFGAFSACLLACLPACFLSGSGLHWARYPRADTHTTSPSQSITFRATTTATSDFSANGQCYRWRNFYFWVSRGGLFLSCRFGWASWMDGWMDMVWVDGLGGNRSCGLEGRGART